MSKTVTAPPSAKDVRAWAKGQKGLKNDLTLRPGQKGRLSPAVREAYNKAHPRNKYQESARVRGHLVLPVPSASGKTVTPKAIPSAEVREAARLAGVVNPRGDVVERGRYPALTADGLDTFKVLGAAFIGR
jgi:hypothetical protein